MKAFSMKWRLHVATAGLCLLVMTGCGPSEKQVAAQAEATRVDCLDKICYGDIAPKIDTTKDAILKLNGQWYVGPKEYFSTGNPISGFEWWEHKPISRGMERPPEMQTLAVDGKGSDFSISIFLTGRQRWSNPNVQKPWEGADWEGRFKELKAQGLQIERKQLRPDLELVRFLDSQGRFYRHEYYLASQQSKLIGQGRPGIACDLHSDAKLQAQAGCNGGFYWQEDVYADFRLHAKHTTDWPAIHQEIIRVLNLAKKAQS
jgi:hypothetical protein